MDGVLSALRQRVRRRRFVRFVFALPRHAVLGTPRETCWGTLSFRSSAGVTSARPFWSHSLCVVQDNCPGDPRPNIHHVHARRTVAVPSEGRHGGESPTSKDLCELTAVHGWGAALCHALLFASRNISNEGGTFVTCTKRHQNCLYSHRRADGASIKMH